MLSILEQKNDLKTKLQKKELNLKPITVSLYKCQKRKHKMTHTLKR